VSHKSAIAEGQMVQPNMALKGEIPAKKVGVRENDKWKGLLEYSLLSSDRKI
jgi:hypothetical protein